MRGHLMSSSDALDLLDALIEHGVGACVGGGWAVDALLGRQTRPHADIDLWLPATQLEHAVRAFVDSGVDRLLPWGNDRPWNFVIHDSGHRRVDLHFYEVRDDGTFHYGGVTGETFPPDALGGRGTIDGRPVRCESPEWSLRWHTGYTPRPEDRHDMALLCAEFGMSIPREFGSQRTQPMNRLAVAGQ